MRKTCKNSGISASDHSEDILTMVTFSRHFNGAIKDTRFSPIICKKRLFSYIISFIGFFRHLAANTQLFDFISDHRKGAKQWLKTASKALTRFANTAKKAAGRQGE